MMSPEAMEAIKQMEPYVKEMIKLTGGHKEALDEFTKIIKDNSGKKMTPPLTLTQEIEGQLPDPIPSICDDDIEFAPDDDIEFAPDDDDSNEICQKIMDDKYSYNELHHIYNCIVEKIGGHWDPPDEREYDIGDCKEWIDTSKTDELYDINKYVVDELELRKEQKTELIKDKLYKSCIVKIIDDNDKFFGYGEILTTNKIKCTIALLKDGQVDYKSRCQIRYTFLRPMIKDGHGGWTEQYPDLFN